MINFSDLRNNQTLNKEAAQEAGLPDGEIFSLANFTYSNSAIVKNMFYHLNNTEFQGITVSSYILKYMLLGMRFIKCHLLF